MPLQRPFYVEEKGSRWAMMAVSYRTREEAEAAAKRDSERNTSEATVYDCSKSPVGVVVAAYRNGKQFA